MKILGVDDNADILKLVQMTVEALGHSFELASNGKDGLEMIRKNKYDMVLLDLSMPGMTGLEVIDALADEGIIRNQHVVLFTASYLRVEDMETKLQDKGVHSIMTKPTDIDNIMERIQQIEEEIKSA